MKDQKKAKTMLIAIRNLEKATEKIDEMVSKRAINAAKRSTTETTFEQVDKILELVNLKKNLVNLKIIVTNTLDRLSYEDQLILKMRYIQGLDFADMEKVFKFTIRSYYRRLKGALTAFLIMLEDADYTDAWFDREYMTVKWISGIYSRLSERTQGRPEKQPIRV